MILSTKYIRPDITIETEAVGSKRLYIYNYRDVHYRAFSSLKKVKDFVEKRGQDWIFECENEKELEGFLRSQTKEQFVNN